MLLTNGLRNAETSTVLPSWPGRIGAFCHRGRPWNSPGNAFPPCGYREHTTKGSCRERGRYKGVLMCPTRLFCALYEPTRPHGHEDGSCASLLSYPITAEGLVCDDPR